MTRYTLYVLLVLGAAGAAALEPGTHELTVRTAEGRRAYRLHLPAAADADKPLPLVLFLHGGGGRSQEAAARYGWRELADEAGFIVAFPEGTPRPGAIRKRARYWNEGSGRGIDADSPPDDVAYLRAVIDDAAKQVKVDTSRVFVSGFSMGASMTWRLGVELPDRIAAVAPVSGHLWLNPDDVAKPTRRPPVLFIVGDADPLNPIDGGRVARRINGVAQKPAMKRSVRRWLTIHDIDIDIDIDTETDAEAEPKPFMTGQVTARTWRAGDDGALTYVVVRDLGHVWPGGTSPFPQRLVGKPTDALDATRAAWAFFQRVSAAAPPDDDALAELLRGATVRTDQDADRDTAPRILPP